MATALKTNCAVETRPGIGSAFKQSLLMRSIEAEESEYITIAVMAVPVSWVLSSGIFPAPSRTARALARRWLANLGVVY